MNTDRISYLVQRARQQQATPEELEELMELLRSDSDGTVLQQLNALYGDVLATGALQDYDRVYWQAAFDEVMHPPATKLRRMRSWMWAAAAAALMLLAAGAWFFQRDAGTSPVLLATSPADIKPGREGAILTLGDGSKVVLDSLKNGVVAAQNGSQVVLRNGQLVYDNTGQSSAQVVYNTISTPKGRQFSMQLPDGTSVWLNAASSIRYPTAFTGWDRSVSISGEVYFEVAKNAEMPFHVSVNEQVTIDVLGTDFNVNAYENERSLNTTLISGSIRIQAGSSVVLKPGQQAQVHNVQASLTVINHADIQSVTAWKNGYFNLNDITLEELMRQVERWYDVEVIYEKGIPAKTFFGKVNRDLSLRDFMEGLKDWGVHFRLEGRKLIVTGTE